MSGKRGESGITLVEALLVIVIGTSILLFAVRQYQIFKLDGDVQQLKYNVDTIFTAMGHYYKVNCYGTTSATGQATYGNLNPLNTPPPQTPIQPIDIENDLRANRFLTIEYPLSPLVDNSKGGGYVAQFNQFTSTRRVCRTASDTGPATSPYSSSCDASAPVATVISWRPQVAVLLKNPALGQQMLALLGGDCLSTLSGGAVARCNGYPGSGEYVVWERSPNYSAAPTATGNELQNQITQQFNQMYTTYPMTYLIGSGGTMPTTGTSSAPAQYIYCGD